jgi:hypothetical protein
VADIDIVTPIYGATRVDFDYAAAGSAIDALQTMKAKLEAQAEGRTGPYNAVVEGWQGPFREDFDEAWRALDSRFRSGAESATSTITSINWVVDRANEQQRQYNRIAEEERARRLLEEGLATPI